MTNAEIQREIVDNGGPDIGVSGAQHDKYAEISKKYPNDSDRDQARQEIADVFAEGEHPSTDPSKNYRQYYSETYEKEYDKNH
jgi:hypothetical protein